MFAMQKIENRKYLRAQDIRIRGDNIACSSLGEDAGVGQKVR